MNELISSSGNPVAEGAASAGRKFDPMQPFTIADRFIETSLYKIDWKKSELLVRQAGHEWRALAADIVGSLGRAGYSRDRVGKLVQLNRNIITGVFTRQGIKNVKKPPELERRGGGRKQMQQAMAEIARTALPKPLPPQSAAVVKVVSAKVEADRAAFAYPKNAAAVFSFSQLELDACKGGIYLPSQRSAEMLMHMVKWLAVTFKDNDVTQTVHKKHALVMRAKFGSEAEERRHALANIGVIASSANQMMFTKDFLDCFNNRKKRAALVAWAQDYEDFRRAAAHNLLAVTGARMAINPLLADTLG